MKFIACADINIVGGRLYSADGTRPPGGQSVRTVRVGELISAADVGGSVAFDEIVGAELAVPEGSGDARVLKDIAARRRAREASRG